MGSFATPSYDQTPSCGQPKRKRGLTVRLALGRTSKDSEAVILNRQQRLAILDVRMIAFGTVIA
jgi:hypothetical protein